MMLTEMGEGVNGSFTRLEQLFGRTAFKSENERYAAGAYVGCTPGSGTDRSSSHGAIKSHVYPDLEVILLMM